MQVKEIERKGLNYKAEITVTAADIDRQVDVQLQIHGKDYKLPGFRPGKVPLKILKERLGRAVMGDVLEKVVDETSQKALTDKGLRAALQPKVEVKSFDEGKDLIYTMSVELLPEFSVMDLKTIEIEKPVAKAPEKEVQKALESLSERYGNQETVAEARNTKDGDVVVIDFDGKTKEGVSFPGMASADFPLKLGSKSMIPGFEEQLLGKKAGDKVAVDVTFPDNYGMKDLAAKQAIFDVTIKEIRAVTAAAIDDALAQKLGMADLEALKKAISEQMEKDYNRLTRMKVKRSLLDALDEGHDFELPEGMVDMEYNAILKQVEQEAKAEKGDQAEAVTPEEKEELKSIAERRVRLGLVLSQVGQAEKISVNDNELQRAVMQEAQQYPGQERQVFEFYRKNRQAIESLRAPIFEDKVIDHILKIAKVTEKNVTIEELSAEEERESPKVRKEKKEGTEKPKKSAKSKKAE